MNIIFQGYQTYCEMATRPDVHDEPTLQRRRMLVSADDNVHTTSEVVLPAADTLPDSQFEQAINPCPLEDSQVS